MKTLFVVLTFLHGRGRGYVVKIYVASSWRNQEQPEVVELMYREATFAVTRVEILEWLNAAAAKAKAVKRLAEIAATQRKKQARRTQAAKR